MAINWDATTREDFEHIRRIVDRAWDLGERLDIDMGDKMSLMMDIEAAHLACPLKLGELLGADDSNFSHDIGGIRRHINRETGALEDCFVPRFAQVNS